MATQLCKFTKNQAEIEKTYLTGNTGTICLLLLTVPQISQLPMALPFLTALDLALVISAVWPPAVELEACFFLSAGHTYIKEHEVYDAMV